MNVEWNFQHLTAATTLTFFAFQGMESATITSDKIEGNESTVKKATLLGTFITAIIYMFSSFVVMTLLSPDALSKSSSPFADASMVFLGPASKYIVAAGAVFSTCGALNGWILMQGHMPMAAAQDGLFPKVFGLKNKYGAPSKGIFITSVIISLLILFNYIKGLVAVFTLMIALSTLAVIVPYLFSIIAHFSIMRKQGNISKLFLSLAGLGFVFWVISGSGWETIFYGLSFIFAGVIFYFITQAKRKI